MSRHDSDPDDKANITILRQFVLFIIFIEKLMQMSRLKKVF